MSVAAALVEDLERGDLPHLCVKTGEPTDRLLPYKLTVVPGWTWLLLLFGIFPFFVARWFSAETVSARIPLSTRAFRRFYVATYLSWGLLAAGVVCLLGALAAGVVLALVGLGLLGAGIVALVVTELWTWIGVEPGKERGTIVLTRVHRDFARALGEVQGRRAGYGERAARL